MTLVGAVGFAGGDAGRLFNAGNLTCLGGPSLAWNILSFPRTAARVDEAKAGRDAAAAQHRATVLSALQDADTSLSRYGRQRENVARLESADAAARRAAALGRQRETQGTASVIDVLDVERQRLQTEQSLAQAQAALTDDYVSLQKALGLGWARRTAARPKPHPRPSTPNADGGSSADPSGRVAAGLQLREGCNSGAVGVARRSHRVLRRASPAAEQPGREGPPAQGGERRHAGRQKRSGRRGVAPTEVQVQVQGEGLGGGAGRQQRRQYQKYVCGFHFDSPSRTCLTNE